jgi:hypothetical protein
MQLKLQRSQRAGGVIGKTVIFCLDARADYSPAEASNISKYRLGGEIIYNSQAARQHLDRSGRQLDRVESDRLRDRASGLALGAMSLALAKLQLHISIASLGRGHHIECKDLPELLDAEKALMEACRNLKQFLDAAATFNGSIILVDFDDGEKVHMSQGALELAALPPPSTESQSSAKPNAQRQAFSNRVLDDIARSMSAAYRDNPKLVDIAGSLFAGLLVLSIFGVSFWSLLFSALIVAGTVTWAMRR